ncbi:MAG: hypothetical protein HYX56_00040 [Chloroflexi bacterium]|nr:hypothetical protein [Chloroflexota bacterium]
MDTLYFDLLKTGYGLGLAVIIGGGLVGRRSDGLTVAAVIAVIATSVLRAGAVDEDPRDVRILLRWLLLAVMCAAALFSAAWASPVARAIRSQTAAADDLAGHAVLKREADRLEGRSRRAMVVAVICGAAALFFS